MIEFLFNKCIHIHLLYFNRVGSEIFWPITIYIRQTIAIEPMSQQLFTDRTHLKIEYNKILLSATMTSDNFSLVVKIFSKAIQTVIMFYYI